MAVQVVPDPSSSLGKKEQVRDMFDDISGKYDFLNRFLSLGIDRNWRKKAIDSLKSYKPKRILDVATGTADLAIEAMRLNPEKVTGVDISSGMLEVGKKKLKTRNIDKIELLVADSEHLPFEDASYDAATVAFGVRNFEHLNAGLIEMRRVLKPGSPLAVLEFSKPTVFPVKQLFQFYFKFILPLTGKLFSKHQSAYSYLPESVKHFPEGADFERVLSDCGYKNIHSNRLTFGICTLYTALA